MDIATGYKQHQQIVMLKAELSEVDKEISYTKLAYKTAFVATFLLYFAFVWGMYVSDLWGFSSWLADNLSEIAALIVYVVLAIALPLTMAMVKEVGYKHFSRHKNEWWIVALIVGILALAGVVYESIVSSSQQQHISTSTAEKSKSFEVITNTKPEPTNSASMASRIAIAEQRLATCKDYVERGVWRHCDESEANLKSLLNSEARAMQSAERAASAAIETKLDALQELKQDAYKPVFKSIRDGFAVTISEAVMIVTMFISVIFEISHLLLILFLSQKLKRRELLAQAIIGIEAAYLNHTGKKFSVDDFADDSVLNMDDVREQSPAPFGFNSPAIAQFNYQKKQEPKTTAGFVNTNARTTWNKGLESLGINSPDDTALNRHADAQQVKRIIERGQQAQPLDSASQLGIPSQSSQRTEELTAVSDTLYPEWRQAIKRGDCRHSKAATQRFIWKLAGDEIQTLTANETARIWEAWKQQGASDGLLKSNPKYQPGNRKPEFILA